MRKVTVEMDLTMLRKYIPSNFFDRLEMMEGKHLVRFDAEKGIKIAIIEFKMKEGYTLDDLELPKMARILDVFKQEGNSYTCLIKVKADRKTRRLTRMFDFDVVYEPPFYATKDKLVLSFISDNRTTKLLLKALEVFGVVKDIHVQKAAYLESNPLAILTERQKEAILAAKRLGYYEVPRRGSTKKVAGELNLSKATTVEHLRKAEERLINYILAGY